MKIIFIMCLLSLLLLECNHKEEVRVFLVPKNYEGPLLIIEDPNAKDTIEVKRDTVLFDFRKSFVLRIRGKFIEGSQFLSNLKYYYVDSVGNKREIPFALGKYTKTDSNKVYVHLKYTQIREGSQCDLISTPKNFKYYFQQQEKLCDSLFFKRP
jgi:hypothetical protein